MVLLYLCQAFHQRLLPCEIRLNSRWLIKCVPGVFSLASRLLQQLWVQNWVSLGAPQSVLWLSVLCGSGDKGIGNWNPQDWPGDHASYRTEQGHSQVKFKHLPVVPVRELPKAVSLSFAAWCFFSLSSQLVSIPCSGSSTNCCSPALWS